ncbi:quinone oxidoreductase-like protein 2 isoform X4 [Ailuropoda melanoleuca]|uniref:quinone oxidoreductase-like protein 2 isoform X4 n=1 Tax=Ailuropoda melanoleuca TaxID=9646 RepID=UPI0014943E0F|nr:quinone oxidoreductase-like protein 2 isoform X4 [Ailuropoda melanoleuca]
MAAVARGRCLPRAWLCRWGPDSPLSPERQPGDPRNPRLALCSRRAGQGCGRHYRAALCAELKQPLAIEEVASRPVRPHETLWQIPERVPLREAATLPVSYGTAVLALEHRAHTRPGETVLVTAAAGATGLAVIDVATNVLHAQVIAAAGSDEKCKLAMQKGAQSVVNYSRGSLKEAVRTLVGSAGVNVAIDTVGGDVFLEALRSLAWEGRIVVVGFAGGTIASVPANLLLLKNVSAMGLYWSRYKEQNFPVFSRTLSSALQYCQQGRIQPHIGAVFKLEEVNDAFLHVIQRKSTGKVLISLK